MQCSLRIRGCRKAPIGVAGPMTTPRYISISATGNRVTAVTCGRSLGARRRRSRSMSASATMSTAALAKPAWLFLRSWAMLGQCALVSLVPGGAHGKGTSDARSPLKGRRRPRGSLACQSRVVTLLICPSDTSNSSRHGSKPHRRRGKFERIGVLRL